MAETLAEFRADLHVHTCLSPCAELEMVPTAIVRRVRARGLHMVGICDHNSSENVAAVARAGRRESVTVIPGMEITTREEVHVLGLFGSEERLARLQALVYENLTGENDAETFGIQVVVDEWDQAVDINPRLLIGATDLSLETVVQAIHDLEGLAIASHVDRPSFSLLSQLGFIPEGLRLDALELSPRGDGRAWTGYPLVRSSDAHRLDDIGRSATVVCARAASFEEIGRALAGEGGRAVVIT